MTVNIDEIDYDKALRGLVDTNALRAALRALEITALHLVRQLGSSFKGLAGALKIAQRTAALSKQLRAAEIYNLNLRRRDWILSCVNRRLWLRGLIGEARIRSWYKRQGGTAPVQATYVLKPQARAPFPKGSQPPRRHNWYTLARLAQVAKIAKIVKIKHPSLAAMKRVEFYPHELTADYIYDGNPVANNAQGFRSILGGRAINAGLNNNALDLVYGQDEHKEKGAPTAPIHKPP